MDSISRAIMNTYIGFYRGRKAECKAMTKYEAQQILAKLLGAKHSYDIAVEVAERKRKPVIHKPLM